MTAVPVVSTQLNTRTVSEARTLREPPQWRPISDESYAIVKANAPQMVRERLVADPVFVVLETAPDLNGSPVYAATWQWRPRNLGEWLPLPQSATDWKPESWMATYAERRQVIQWRATDVTVLPVVDASLPTSPSPYPWISVDAEHAWGPGMEPYHQEPWAVDLRPGQFVLRLDGWEHLEQPYTLMVERFISDDPDDDGEERWDTAPLSVPDGVLSWIELAS